MQDGTILIQEKSVNSVTSSKYLGASVQENGGVEQEIRRVQPGRTSWREKWEFCRTEK